MIVSNSNFYIAICFHINTWFWSKRNFNCICGALTSLRLAGKLTAHHLSSDLPVTKSVVLIVCVFGKILKTFPISVGHYQKTVAFCYQFNDQQGGLGMFYGIMKNFLDDAVDVYFFMLIEVNVLFTYKS